MGKSWIAVLFAALAAFSFRPSLLSEDSGSPAAEIRCLAVGIDRFVNEENTSPCSANNVEEIAGLFTDCLPEGKEPVRIRIEYKKQARLGDCITPEIYHSGADDITVSLAGEDGKAYAAAQLLTR